jgi:hypothetical protein
MCESLLDTYDKTEMPDQDCEFHLHTVYKIALGTVDPGTLVPRARAEAELSVTWHQEAI